MTSDKYGMALPVNEHDIIEKERAENALKKMKELEMELSIERIKVIEKTDFGERTRYIKKTSHE